MRELFRIPRVAPPAWTRRSLALAVAGVIVLSAVITPGVSSALAVFTMQKAAKISLGNTNTVTVAGTAAPGLITPLTVNCPPNHQAIGGGADSPELAGTGPDLYPWLFESAPVGTGKSVGWYVEVYNPGSGAKSFTAYAICSP